MAPDPPSLFHYTTAQGLLGIIDSGSIWASDCRFLNDSREIEFGIEAVKEAIKGHPNADSRIVRLIVARLAPSITPVFVSCFCRTPDVLSMWRAYSAGHGYCLELDLAALREDARKLIGADEVDDHTVRAVEYGTIGAPHLAHMLAIAPDEALDQLSEEDGANFVLVIARAMASVAAGTKHDAFREEQEWRIEIAPEILGKQFDVQFRASDVAIVPYIAVPISLDAIRSVTVGPGGNEVTRQAGVRRVLEARGIGAPVHLSDVPLR